MACRILVMSPLHNMGATVISELIAQAVTYNNKISMLLFNELSSLLPSYLGVSDINDPTRSIMQVVQLIENGAIRDADILDYTHVYAPNAHLVNVTDKSLNTRDRSSVVQHIYDRTPTDIVVCDNSEDLTSDVSEVLIKRSDVIFLVVDMSIKMRTHLDAWLNSEQLKNKNNIYLIVNRYDETVNSLRNLAKWFRLPANRVCKIHYNPWIAKCCLTSQLQTMLPLARELDPRVAHMNADIDEINQCINANMITKIKKGF